MGESVFRSREVFDSRLSLLFFLERSEELEEEEEEFSEEVRREERAQEESHVDTCLEALLPSIPSLVSNAIILP